MTWNTIDSAPKDGTRFLAFQDGEIYEARYAEEDKPRITFRTHNLFVEDKHRIINATMDGRDVKARVEVDKPWTETFRHDWTYWTRGFDFNPTHWAPRPADPV